MTSGWPSTPPPEADSSCMYSSQTARRFEDDLNEALRSAAVGRCTVVDSAADVESADTRDDSVVASPRRDRCVFPEPLPRSRTPDGPADPADRPQPVTLCTLTLLALWCRSSLSTPYERARNSSNSSTSAIVDCTSGVCIHFTLLNLKDFRQLSAATTLPDYQLSTACIAQQYGRNTLATCRDVTQLSNRLATTRRLTRVL